MGSSPSKREQALVPKTPTQAGPGTVNNYFADTVKAKADSDAAKSKTDDGNDEYSLQQASDNVVTIMDKLNQTQDFGEGDAFSLFNELIRIYYILSKVSLTDLGKVCEVMIRKGLLELFLRIWDDCHQNAEEFYSDTNSVKFNNLNRMKVIFWNYSDKCVALAKACHKDGRVIERLMREFTIPQLGVECLKQHRIRHMLKATLGILHNLVRLHDHNRNHIRKNDGIEKILEYEKSTYLIVKAKIFIVLAYCINEDENSKIMTGSGVINFIIELLKSAVSSPNHVAKVYAFSADETVAALNKLASNDDNKKTIVDAGVLPLLTELLDPKTSSSSERLAAVNCIWSLAFHPENREKIIDEPDLIDMVKYLRGGKDSSPKLDKACSSVLFVLSLEQPSEELTVRLKSTKKHIMLSYNWEVQPIIKRLRDFLKQENYSIWIDIDMIQDSILAAMADGVENSAVILVAMTEAYKNSNSCRTEAEYAYKREVPIQPLLLQAGYIPDGWLGAVVGTKLYVDLSFDAPEENFPVVKKQIDRLIATSTNEKSVVAVDAPNPGGLEVAKISQPVGKASNALARMTSVDGGSVSLVRANIPCKQWTTKEVVEWYRTTGIKENGTLRECDGIIIAQLCKLLLRCPQTYYALLRDELHLGFKDMLLFTDAIEALIGS